MPPSWARPAAGPARHRDVRVTGAGHWPGSRADSRLLPVCPPAGRPGEPGLAATPRRLGPESPG